jgi:two-component system, OmpR family, phosphate regulon sensor histidine kinase PhoR
MKSPATVAARVRVAIVCGLVLSLFAGAFMFRVHDAAAATDKSAVFELGVLLVIGAIVCGMAIAIVASSIAIAPLDAMTITARAMRRDLGIRTRMRGEDELGQLGEALDGLAGWVASEKQGLEDDRNRLVAILESMTEGVLVTSGDGAHDGVVVLANAALREMFLLDRAIIGRPPVEAIRVSGLDEILARAATSKSGSSGELELGGLRPRIVFVRVAPIKSDRPGLVAVFNDVTELRRLESVRRDFVANVSHELRTPIHAISSSAETLQNGALNDKVSAAEFVDIIARHSTRLQRLVEDLLELSRIEAREWKLDPTSTDADEVVAAAIEAVGVAAAQREATLSRTDAGLSVLADRRALEHVLANLLDNAVKYGGQKPVIDVTVERAGESVVFRVRDHGPGIEPRHLPRVFERFYRVDPGRSRAVGGTGLGLSIVKNLVEAMDGSVEVESNVGTGTTFTVTLPSSG